MSSNRGLSRWLKRSPGWVLPLYAATVAFSTYFCMYAFRKPFAAATFKDLKFLGYDIDLKTAFVISQIVGYALSKYLGIKFCSEVTRRQRAWALVGLIATAEGALLLFAVLPRDLKVIGMFFNGLPLGMVWGLVVWYLEGRKTSELLLAGLSCSFIVSSGIVKDVGSWLMASRHIDQFWMPFTAGLIFLPLFLLSTWLLNQVPSPTVEDVIERVEREPMDGEQRLAFVRQFFLGLLLLLVTYFFLTAYRDFRDNFGAEVFKQLGYTGKSASAIFTRSELPVAFGVMLALALLNLVRDNRRGLIAAYGIMIGGLLLMGGATLLLDAKVISGLWWMILVGLGSYLAYVPFGSVLFDRIIASTRVVGTAVFAIYVADAIGYTGSVGVQLFKDREMGQLSRLAFLHGFTYLLSIFGSLLLIGSCLYFVRKSRTTAVGFAVIPTAESAMPAAPG